MVYVKILLSTDLTDISEIKTRIQNELDKLQEKGFTIEETLITHKKDSSR